MSNDPVILRCVCCGQAWPGQWLAGFQVWCFNQVPCDCRAPFRTVAAEGFTAEDTRFLKTLRIANTEWE